MSSSIVATTAPDGDYSNTQGHCRTKEVYYEQDLKDGKVINSTHFATHLTCQLISGHSASRESRQR